MCKSKRDFSKQREKIQLGDVSEMDATYNWYCLLFENLNIKRYISVCDRVIFERITR